MSPKGAVFYCGNSTLFETYMNKLNEFGYSNNLPQRIPINDKRANKCLSLLYTDSWYVIPSPEVFTRHSGTCVVLGDRRKVSAPFQLKLGDFFRLGSVGLVVSELRTSKGTEERLDHKELQHLRAEALAINFGENYAVLAADELSIYSNTDKSSLDLTAGDKSINSQEKISCYMCYETHDTPTDRLVAPCICKGDTRYVHVQCLQKWYFSAVNNHHAHVIRTTGSGAPACKICGAAYKTNFRNANGTTENVLHPTQNDKPYISLIVVTKHDVNTELFNTKFTLTFGDTLGSDIEDIPRTIRVGRSSGCNMVLDYRTVSTVHALISYENNKFYIKDNKSSNGTMIFLKSPRELSYGEVLKLRTGRTTISLLPRRSWTASVSDLLGSGARMVSSMYKHKKRSKKVKIDEVYNTVTQIFDSCSPVQTQDESDEQEICETLQQLEVPASLRDINDDDGDINDDVTVYM